MLRASAQADLEAAFNYYFEEANLILAGRFRDEADNAMVHIAEHPGTGSPRHSPAKGKDAIRFWAVKHFPYSIFYIERPSFIDVFRVLHQASNIPNHLTTD